MLQIQSIDPDKCIGDSKCTTPPVTVYVCQKFEIELGRACKKHAKKVESEMRETARYGIDIRSVSAS